MILDGLDYWQSDGYRHCATYKSDLDKIGNLDVIEGMWIFEERDILDNSLNKIYPYFKLWMSTCEYLTDIHP